MELADDGEGSRDNAVPLYFLEIPHFTLLEEPKVFKNNVSNVYFASRKLCTFFIIKLSYIPINTMFLSQSIHLNDFFYFFTISSQAGFPGVFTC